MREPAGTRERTGAGANERRILVLAPVGRTAALAKGALEAAGLPCQACGTMDELCAAIKAGAGAALLLEEALTDAESALALARAIETQPAWSDLPVQVFVSDPESPPQPLAHLRDLPSGRSVVVLERPIRPTTLVSLMRAALRHRDRQYQLRDMFSELRAARWAAERASAAKSDFLAVMSHELRTPLNAVIGYEDLLASETVGAVNEAQRRFLDRIRTSAWYLLELIEDILTFSRVEAGKETIHCETVEASSLVRDAVALLEPRATTRGLVLQVHLPDAPVEIETDRRKLRQILLNLLSNAVKFTEAGEAEVRLELDAEGGMIVTVRDTGVGIAPEDMDRIFEPFEQVDSSTTRREQGTGLGLGVSRNLARLLGGDLTCESQPGVGSTFVLRLPTCTPAARGPGEPVA